MKIVANGDSFTAEAYFYPKGKEHLWTNKIGAENIAYGGCSNDWIFYSTIDYLNNNEPDVLIIGWTNIDRYHLTHTNGSNIHVNVGSVGDDKWYGFGSNEKEYKEYGEFYYKKMYNPYLNYLNFLNYYRHLEKYCEAKEIRYLNFCSHKNLLKNELLEKHEDLKDKVQAISPEHWVNRVPGYTFEEHVKDFPKWEDGYHPGLEASDEWHKVILSNLN